MKPSEQLDLSADQRRKLWQDLFQHIEAYFGELARIPVSHAPSLDVVKQYLSTIDFNKASSPSGILAFVTKGLDQYQVHTPHPGYFGLFNPAASAMGIVADALVAAYNPQLAAWSHSPFPNEIENMLIREFGKQFYGHEQVDGTFASGGAEANHTALLCALTQQFPEFQQGGLLSLRANPCLYVSTESHHSFLKAARLCGLGAESVRMVPVDNKFSMDVAVLQQMITADRKSGFSPFFVAATAGTTNCGAIDPLSAIAAIAREEGMWYHVDAAWGGAVCLHPSYSQWLEGIAMANSITFDAHKWLSVPMGAGMFITTQTDILQHTFGIETAYMPVKNQGEVINPFHHSIQWSRRFTGLKLFLTLAVAGWDGYREVIGHMVCMGDMLKTRLTKAGWNIINNSPLPVVCFAHREHPGLEDLPVLEKLCAEVTESGQAWISTTTLDARIPVLRACITNYRTEPGDIDRLIETLAKYKKDSAG